MRADGGGRVRPQRVGRRARRAWGAVKGWCVDESPAQPPWPGSSAVLGWKSGKSVTQRKAKPRGR